MSRVDSSRIAARKAEDAARAAGLATPLTKGSVVASDAFFPFADGLIAAVEAGATAVIQPGGSMRDAEVIAARRRGGNRDGVHRDAAFPALRGGAPAGAPCSRGPFTCWKWGICWRRDAEAARHLDALEILFQRALSLRSYRP